MMKVHLIRSYKRLNTDAIYYWFSENGKLLNLYSPMKETTLSKVQKMVDSNKIVTQERIIIGFKYLERLLPEMRKQAIVEAI